MIVKTLIVACTTMLVLLGSGRVGGTAEIDSQLEKAMSDTLDTWREKHYEQLFEQLAHRGKTSKESFVKKMRDSTIQPACCWQKMEHFKVLDDQWNAATVYAKIGFEGPPGSAESVTREFKLTQQDGTWKMQLGDVLALAGAKKTKASKKRHAKKTYINLN
jgi:hypothetical protein